jgi:hypothetical protein
MKEKQTRKNSVLPDQLPQKPCAVESCSKYCISQNSSIPGKKILRNTCSSHSRLNKEEIKQINQSKINILNFKEIKFNLSKF